MINHQSSTIIQYGSLGFRGPEPWYPGARSPGIPGPGALGFRGPEPWDPGAWNPDPGARNPGIPGPKPWDPGAQSPGIPGPRALGSRGPAIPFYTFSSRNRSGIGFLSSRIAENDRLGLGTSKIEVLAKNSKKNQGKLPGKVTFPRPPTPPKVTKVTGPNLKTLSL